jgi:hypothetical protein
VGLFIIHQSKKTGTGLIRKENIIDEGEKMNYAYPLGITERGDDNWVWQGMVVAPNHKIAKRLAQAFKRKNFGSHSHRVTVLSEWFDERVKSKKRRGVYDSTSP